MPFDPKTVPVGQTVTEAGGVAPDKKQGDALLQQLVNQHGGVISSGQPIQPLDPTTQLPAIDPTTKKPAVMADPYRQYTLADGTVVVMNGQGAIYTELHGQGGYSDIKELPSKSDPSKHTLWGTNPQTGAFEEVPNAPTFDPNALNKVDAGQHPAIPTEDGRMMIWDPSATNTRGGKGNYVDSGAPPNPIAAANAKNANNELIARAGLQNAQAQLNQQQIDVLKAKTQPEIDELVKRGNLSQAQADQITALLPGAVTQQTATTAKINAETGLTDAQTQAVIGKTPAEIDELVARKVLTLAQADQIKQNMQLAGATQASEINLRSAQAELAKAQAAKAAQPTQMQAPNDQMWIVYTDASGNQQSKLNPNYQPKDPAYAVMQLQAQQKAYADQLQQQVNDGKIDANQAAQQWDQWNQMNVEPLKQGIQQAQQQLAFTNQVSAASSAANTTNAAANAQNAATQNLTAQGNVQKAASDIGTAAVNAANALPTGMVRVGPGFGQEMNKISSAMANPNAPAANVDWGNALVWQPPDTQAIYKNAVADALKHISPMAAQITNAPQPTPPGQMDLNALLNRSWNSYAPTPGQTTALGGTDNSGGGAIAAARAAAAGAPAAPTPGNTLASNDPAYLAWLQAQKYQPAGSLT